MTLSSREQEHRQEAQKAHKSKHSAHWIEGVRNDPGGGYVLAISGELNEGIAGAHHICGGQLLGTLHIDLQAHETYEWFLSAVSLKSTT